MFQGNEVLGGLLTYSRWDIIINLLSNINRNNKQTIFPKFI